MSPRAGWSRSGLKEAQMSELEPTPELPDNTPIREVRFAPRIKIALLAAGIETVGKVREMSDQALLDLPDFGRSSLAHVRQTLGLPSTDGVRPQGKKAT
jgi:DNA-directed RNA polymerase alpha subunit